MNEKTTSILKLDRISFEEIQFHRDTSLVSGNVEYEMNFNRNIGRTDDGSHFCVKLTANIWAKEPNKIDIKVTVLGYFSIACEDNTLKDKMIKYNTLSILFPYLRSQVSLITAQPDLSPLVIPPVNIVSLFEEVDKNNTEDQK